MGILNATWYLRQVKVTWAEITTHALWAQYFKILMCNFTEKHSPNKAKQAEFDTHFLFSTFMSQQSSFYMCKSSLFGALLDWTSRSQQWMQETQALLSPGVGVFLRSIWPQETLPGANCQFISVNQRSHPGSCFPDSRSPGQHFLKENPDSSPQLPPPR